MARFKRPMLVLIFVAIICTANSLPTVIDPILGTLLGTVQTSTSTKTSEAFLGMPFAIPPLGARRFAPAQLWAQEYPQNTTYDTFGDDCYQGNSPPDPSHPAQSEDCLTINVWRPSTSAAQSEESLSVLVWIYGGGFQAGSAAVRWYNGAAMAANQNVIVVSLNYRVGALGFLASKEIDTLWHKGNGGLNGIHDQIVGLQWVHNYIKSFGGDPSSVTIMGQSAGGESVCVLSLAPPAKGLFQRAIVQSGPCAFSYWQAQNATFALALGKMVFDANNVTTIAELQQLPVADITWPDGPSSSQFFNGYFAPDGYVLPHTAEAMLTDEGGSSNINPTDMIVGTNSMDGTLTFVYGGLRVPVVWFHYNWRMRKLYNPTSIPPSTTSPRAKSVLDQYPLSRFNSTTYNGASYAYIRSDSDRALVCPSKTLATAFANGIKGRVYHYVYEYGPSLSTCDIVHTTNPICPRDEILHWASHGQENRLVFGTENGPDEISSPSLEKHCPLTGKDLALSLSMQTMWADFAKHGVPSTTWPSVVTTPGNATEMATMRIGLDGGVVVNYREADCLFWQTWNEKYGGNQEGVRMEEVDRVDL